MPKPAESYESGKEKSQRIDRALKYLVIRKLALMEPGDDYPKMTIQEIADFVGTDPAVIFKAEQSALRKLKSKLGNIEL